MKDLGRRRWRIQRSSELSSVFNHAKLLIIRGPLAQIGQLGLLRALLKFS